MYKMRKAGSLDYDTLGKLLRMIEGALFTREFLLEGIRETEVWRTLDDVRVSKFCADAKSMLTGLSARKNPNEAQTEEDLVYPLLECLGWHHRDVQPNASVKLRNDVPDALLFSGLVLLSQKVAGDNCRDSVIL